MSGLCLARLDFVGDANDGRCDLVASPGGGPGGVVDVAEASLAGSSAGDILRRFDADVSMARLATKIYSDMAILL
jgi:hypothetical protein